jgi:N-acetylglucosamine malate deacetylase 1
MPLTTISAAPWRRLRWLVIAPHPDDETLGVGALIAQTAREGTLAGIVYLTDGSGSHPMIGGRSLVRIRRREAALAIRRLASRAAAPIHLDWRDASPYAPGERGFEISCRALVALCDARRVDVLAVTASHEPHCDHSAAAQLARAVRSAARRRLRVIEYLVWGDEPKMASMSRVATAPMTQGIRRSALFSHRSQLTGVYGPGFRLPRSAARMPSRDILYHSRHSHAG